MRRSRAEIDHNDLVIVCEGSTTEYNYFNEIRTFIDAGKFPSCPYTYIHIIPGDTGTLKSTNRKKKNLDYGSKAELRYFEKCEQSLDDYKEYRSQPVRYVREAELFLIDSEKPYDEAWAVYDWDVKPDKPQEKKHHKVFPILERNPLNLHVAFSSYSFEEWFLMHFEKNDKVFTSSDCSDDKDNSYMCGTHPTDYTGHDCHGNECIAGYLRENNYIKDYAKEDEGLFSKYTFENGSISQTALYNSAWLRSRSNVFCADSYTNVDELVCRIIGLRKRIIWKKLGDSFPIGSSEITVNHNTEELIVENVGNKTCVLKYYNISITDNPMQTGEVLSEKQSEVLSVGMQKVINVSRDRSYMRIIDGDNVIIVDLCV